MNRIALPVKRGDVMNVIDEADQDDSRPEE